MIRECKDCHRIEDAPFLTSSGGWCAPADTIYDWPTPTWICAECRAKYPEPQQYRATCEECRGQGTVVAHHTCEGCGHGCSTIVQCEWCDGQGWYMTHDCNPGCDHSSLPLFSVSRGGIKFS